MCGQFRFLLWFLGTLLVAPILISSALAAGDLVESRGGSNFLFFDLQGCDRDKFAVLPDYDIHGEAVDNQLMTMYRNGQRRLRTAIPPPRSLVIDSTSVAIDANYKRNVADFLAAIRRTGFAEVEIGFGSVGPPPFKWNEWREDLYLKRWQMITELRPLLLASELHYHIDLLNEGIPASNQPILLHYVQRLWIDYTKSFGKNDTVGFSIITDIAQDRFNQIPSVYGKNPPAAFDLHIYDHPFDSLVRAHDRLNALGYAAIPWIIGETYYDDASEASEIARGIRQTGQRVLFLTQWPLHRVNETCDAVDVVPVEFSEYMKQGF